MHVSGDMPVWDLFYSGRRPNHYIIHVRRYFIHINYPTSTLGDNLSTCSCTWVVVKSNKQKYRGMFETQMSGNKTSSGLWQKTPALTEKSNKQRDNTKTPPKTSITQRLPTDLGQSVGEAIATRLVWLNQLTGSQPSHSSQQLCYRRHEHAMPCIILQLAEIWGL